MKLGTGFRTKNGVAITLEVNRGRTKPMDLLQWDCLLRRWEMRKTIIRTKQQRGKANG